MQRRTLFVIAAVLAAAGTLPLMISGCPTGTGTAIGSGTSVFNRPPSPIITSDLVSGVAPLTVQFNSDRSTDDGLIVTRAWDFGDGGTSQQIAPKHTFQTNGDFTVKLTLTDDGGLSESTTLEISVTDAPTAAIAYSPTTGASRPGRDQVRRDRLVR